MVHLVLQTGENVRVARRVAEMSVLIREMLADEGEGEDEEGEEIPLPNVSKDILTLALEFCIHHVDDPMALIEKPLKSNNMLDVVSEWDAAFIELDIPVLFKLILAANYLDIPDLLDLSCAKVASMLMGKIPDQVKTRFGITNQYAPEDPEQVKEEEAWIQKQYGL
jgi:S-phase kinase-associated protein 1